MASSQEVTEIVTVAFNPSLLPPSSPPSPPVAFAAVAAQLKAAPGVNAVYVGQQLEQPSLWTVIVRWAAESHYADFVASEAFMPFLTAFKATLIDEDTPEAKALPPRQIPVKISFDGGSVDGPLAAPTTEVFSCYDTDAGFVEENIKPFSEGLDAAGVPGYHGLAYGSFTYEGEDQPKGQAARLLIGWDSKEAHLAQRGEGKVIDKYIDHVRTGRKAVDVYHVNLTRL